MSIDADMILDDASFAVVTEADDQVTITFANPGGPFVIRMPMAFADRLAGELRGAEACARTRGIIERGGQGVPDEYRAGQERHVDALPEVREFIVPGHLEG